MVTIGMNYKMIPGKEKIFEDAFVNVIKVIVSEWNSEDAYNVFIQSDKFKGVVDWGKENILAGRPSHKVYKN